MRRCFTYILLSLPLALTTTEMEAGGEREVEDVEAE